MKKFVFSALCCLVLAGCAAPETPTNTAAAPAVPDAMAEPAATAAPTNPETYGQYLACKIDGQPYLAYYADGHTTNVSNPVNMARRTDFATSADQVPLNGDTKLSELHLLLFGLAKKRAGTYTSPNDFTLDGHTCFAKKTGTGVDDIHFTLAKNQQLTVSSLEKGVVKGHFTADVVDDHDPAHVLHLTEGTFKLALDGGVKEIGQQPNGDVDMDKLMKDALK